jgi:hypothetical protein
VTSIRVVHPGEDLLDLDPYPHAVAISMAQPDPLRAAPGPRLQPLPDRTFVVVRVDELQGPPPRHLLRSPSQHPGRAFVDLGDDAIEVQTSAGSREARLQ